MSKISEERLVEVMKWAALEEIDCMADDRPITAECYGDAILALSELQALRSGGEEKNGVGEDARRILEDLADLSEGDTLDEFQAAAILKATSILNTDLPLRAENERLRHDNSDLLAGADADAYVSRQLLARATTAEAKLDEAVKVLEWTNNELKDHGYAEIGTLRATVIGAIKSTRSFLANLKGAE